MGDPLKILLLILSLRVGGAERMAVNLVNGWKDLGGVDTTVISLSDHNPLLGDIIPDACRFFCFPRRSRFDLSFVKQIQDRLRLDKSDVILTFGFFEYFIARLATIGMKRRPRIFISIHSTAATRKKNPISQFIQLKSLSPEDHILSVCEAQADYWSRAFHIPRRMFTTIYNGVDIDHYSPSLVEVSRSQVRHELSIPPDAFVILQVASFAPYKKQSVSIKALQLLVDSCPSLNPYLLLVGGGSLQQEEYLKALCASNRVKDRVIFCGIQSDVRPYHLAADLFTLPSSIETFSVAALEAMAMGLPCVLSDVGGAREMLIDGVNGTLAIPEDPVALAQSWQKIIDQRGNYDPAVIRDYIETRFSLKTCVKNYIDIFTGR